MDKSVRFSCTAQELYMPCFLEFYLMHMSVTIVMIKYKMQVIICAKQQIKNPSQITEL